jgi:Icc-related predicted phosphoesterase
MRLRIASDLHFEFMRDGGKHISQELTADPGFDVLIVAGDISSFKGLCRALVTLCQASPKPVIYVLGNHDAYGSTWKAALDEARRATSLCDNLHVLEREVLELDGQRFVGCTLWFPHDGIPKVVDRCLGDFHYIKDIYEFLPDVAAASRRFLNESIREGDVVVTHHLPHPRSVHPKYAGSQMNPFFLHDVSGYIEHYEPALWIHGHTHTSFDYMVGKTRIVANPFGYAQGSPGEPNPEFKGALTVEIRRKGP